jgi:hypothetical protein
MRARQLRMAVLTFTFVAASSAAFAQAPAAPAPPTTIWSFMGIKPGCVEKLKVAHKNKNGCKPQKEKKPLLKAIADPANLEAKNPAIAAAAQIKTEEDLAPQKIKAIKYLGAVGCGCYPGVKEALLAALDDCTEEVRYTAAVALIQAAGGCAGCMPQVPPKPRGLLHMFGSDDDDDEDGGCPQPTCGCGRSCCDLEMKKKLADVAFEKTDGNCWKEPSARVRQAAAQALAVCNSRPSVAKPTDIPQGPGPEVIPSPSVPEIAPGASPETAPLQPVPANDGAWRNPTPARESQHRGAASAQSAPVAQPALVAQLAAQAEVKRAAAQPEVQPEAQPKVQPVAESAAADKPKKTAVKVVSSYTDGPVRSASTKVLGGP